MRKLLIISMVTVILTSLIILFVFLNEHPKIDQGIIIYVNNNYYKISPDDGEYSKLSEECVNILKSINGQYKLAMTLDRLNSIKSQENYVEIVFPESLVLTTEYKPIKLEGAVFMLSGKYKDVIFTYRNKIVGVWSSNRNFDRLRKIVKTFIQHRGK